MTLSEKIMHLRKREGWSQEDLGDRLDVSRQSVSKWESGISIPDIDKIIRLSEIFGVSTDYLLKDGAETDRNTYAEEPEGEQDFCSEEPYSAEKSIRFVDTAEADDFISTVWQAARCIALGVSLCIVSPAALFILGVMSEVGPIAESAAVGIGLTILLLLVAGAVWLFISHGMRLERYEYLEKEPICLENGLEAQVRAELEEYHAVFRRNIAIGVVIIILGVIPLVATSGLGRLLVLTGSLCLLLFFAAVGVNLLVRSCMVHGAYQKLLQQGDYTPKRKAVEKRFGTLAGVYWCCVTALYLGLSFAKGNWHISWVIWPVAGVLFAALHGIAEAAEKRK